MGPHPKLRAVRAERKEGSPPERTKQAVTALATAASSYVVAADERTNAKFHTENENQNACRKHCHIGFYISEFLL